MYAYPSKRDLAEHMVRGFRRSLAVAWSLCFVFFVSSALASCDADEPPHCHTVCAEACDVALQVCTDDDNVLGCYLGWVACAEVCEDLLGR
jgi:hypothetical protein